MTTILTIDDEDDDYELVSPIATTSPLAYSINIMTVKLRRPSAEILCDRPPAVWPFELKIDTPDLAWPEERLHWFRFFYTFRFRFKSPYGMDGRARPVMPPIKMNDDNEQR